MNEKFNRILLNPIFLLTFFVFIFVFPVVSQSMNRGENLDIVPFGEIQPADSSGKEIVVLWEDPRDIVRVNVTFDSSSPIPPLESLTLQYWQSQWPKRRIPRDQPSGAGSSGWLDIGDWFQGEWKTADTQANRQGDSVQFTFRPINSVEFPDLKDFPAEYRTTLKLRLSSSEALPKILSLQAFTDSTIEETDVEILWGGTAGEPQNWDGRLEIFNGFIQKIEPLSTDSLVAVQDNHGWKSNVQNRMDGIRASLFYAKPVGYNSFDETIVTVRAKQETFSFAIHDLLNYGHIFIPDYGVLVRKSGEAITYAQAEEKSRTTLDTDLYTRVHSMPEQTFTQAWNDTPVKAPHYIPLSFEGGRQHFRLDEQGNIACLKNWISRIPGKDTSQCRWEGDEIQYRFGLPDKRLADRTLEEGYLPIVISRWKDSGIFYTQTCYVLPLHGIPHAGGRIWADDTLVLMMRLEFENESDSTATAQITISSQDGSGTESLILNEDGVFVQDSNPAQLRMRIESQHNEHLYLIESKQGALAYSNDLEKSSSKAYLDIAIPFVTLTDENEKALLTTLDFERSRQDIARYWQGRLDASTRIVTPEPMINDFYNAHLSHLLINTEREAGVSDCYMAKVGTFHYGVYSNESCMMISDLDRRGMHERAAQAINTWLKYQGTVGLPGDYSTTEGQFYGAGGYEAGGYNQHHGWILWCMGEHYRYTQDEDWLQNAASQIVRGCDWIIQERRRTYEIADRSPLRGIERGLLPPGSLEDIGDWRCWMSTNVYSWWGMENAAAALFDIGHPDGKRLMDEAEAYRSDILAAFREAMLRSPVVRLRDGRWIPHVPSEAHRRGRSFGWLTETLEGAIHLVRTEIIDPRSRLADWIVQDFEDNLYLSKQYGYDLTGEQFERFWFSLGGISMQANLLHNPIPYLLRDEPKHFLRAYFNAFAVSYFPDTRMMTEHALPSIGDWRGDHFKSSDEANSTYWLRLMFVQEREDELWYGAAIPRYWLAKGQEIGIQNASTYFGVTSMKMKGEGNVLRMTIEPPRRNPPRIIRARFRHPEGKRMISCTINEKETKDFDPEKEWVSITLINQPLDIRAYYE